MKYIFCIFLLVASLHAQDNLSLIHQLPKTRAAVLQKAKPLWDTGDPAKIQEGNLLYKNALLDMIQKISDSFYPKDHFGKQGIQGKLDKICESLADLYADLNENKKDADGTMKKVNASADINIFLEGTLRDLVFRVTAEQKNFDIQKWNQEWDGLPQETKSKTKKMETL